MEDILFEHKSQFRIVNGALYITPNWNGDANRVAMSCGMGAQFMAYIPSYGIQLTDGFPRNWNMVAKNTILRYNGQMYLYARVERDGSNGMYIWSKNVYDVEGVSADTTKSEMYYYIQVGHITASSDGPRTLTVEYGTYGQNAGDLGSDGINTLPYTWSDIFRLDTDENGNRVILFLHNVYNVIAQAITIAGIKISKILTSASDADEAEAIKGGDNALVTGGFLSKWLQGIRDIFLRKDQDDETEHQLTMKKAIVRSSIETQGYNGKDSIDGTGAAMWESDDRGEKVGHIVTDYFTVRRAAAFRNLSIIEVNHMGGEFIISAADCDIAYVDPLDGSGNVCSPDVAVCFRCYFEKEANGRIVYNEWKRNDQAYCRRFNVAEKSEVDGSFYWRMVLDVHNATENETFHWIDLSNILDDDVPQVALNSNTPKADDKIVVFGHQCHRDAPGESFYDRTCAQMYSTVGINAPSRDYYYGIGTLTDKDGNIIPFALPSSSMEGVGRNNEDGVYWHVGDNKHYMNYSTEKGLDIRTSSMTVIADGGDKEIDVAEVLGDSWSFFTTENEARKEGKEYVEWMAAAELVPNEADQWDSSVWKNYLNYQIITPYGITYKLDMNGDEVMWHLNTDRHLIHAQETADAAIQNLEDIANDNIVTVQEKSRLNDIYTQIAEEGNNVLNDAVQVGMRDTDTRTYRVWRSAIMAVIKYITTTEGDVELLKDDGDQLVVNMQRYDAVPDVFYGKADVVDAPMIPSPLSNKVTYSDCYKWYYYYLSILRQNITLAINRKINNIVAGSSDVNQEVFNTIDNLREELLGEENGVVSKINGQLGLLATKGGDDFSGFLTKSNYASVFASGIGQDGKELKAAITAYINGKDSEILLTADKIDFASGSVSVFTNDFVIYSDGFTLTKEGNATFSGELKAATGTFGGKMSSEHGRSKFEIDPTLQSLSMKVALEYTESGEEVSTSKQVEILELGSMQGTGSGTEGNMKYQRVAYVTCRSYNSLGQLYHVASIDGTNGFRSRYYDSSLNVTSEVDVSAQGVLLKGHAILAVENITTIDKDDADHRKYLLPGQVYRVNGERTLKINV